MNYTAVTFWVVATGVGFLVTSTLYGAVAGLTIAAGISFVVEMLG